MWDKGWDKIFSKTEWGKYPSEELIRFISRNFYAEPNRKDIRILEVGCGIGANLWFLAREGFNTFGIDGSQIAIEQAKSYLAGEGLVADIQKGDAMYLPYPDLTFDAVIDVECIYANSLVDSEKILNEVKDESEKLIIEMNEKFHKTSEIKKNLAQTKINQMKESAIKEIKDTSIKIAIDSVKKIITTTVDKSKLDNLFEKNLEETKSELKKINS